MWEKKLLWVFFFPSKTGKALLSYVATVCTHAGTCAHVWAWIWRPEATSDVFLNHPLPYFLRQGLSLIEPTAGLAELWASGIHQRPHQDYIRMLLCPHSKWILGDLSLGLHAYTPSSLLPEPFSQPVCNYFLREEGETLIIFYLLSLLWGEPIFTFKHHHGAEEGPLYRRTTWGCFKLWSQ